MTVARSGRGGWVALVLVLSACTPGDDDSTRRGSAPARSLQPAVAGGGVAASAPEWWRQQVFYEVFVRSFADATTGPLAGDGIGDLAGLIEKLDYLNDGDPESGADLGVGGLWLMPIAQSPSYHGYDVTDYYRVDEDYGTNDDFRRLIAEAHKRGIRVLVDLVLNHTSARHPWFLEAERRRSPRQDWYIWSEEKQDYLGPWGQPVWHQLPWWLRGWQHFNYAAYYGIFSAGMPDLDYRNPEVTAEMFEVARFWLAEMGADGFRLDAIRHLIEVGAEQEDTAETHDWLRRFHAYCKSVKPQALLVGEVWSDAEDVATYGGDELDLAFQFGKAQETLVAVRTGSAAPLVAEEGKLALLFPDSRFASFLTNHDQPRVMSAVASGERDAKLAAALLLTGEGVPFIYYGEEIGLSGVKPDPLIRRPLPWSDAPFGGFSTHRPWQRLEPGSSTRNVEAQLRDPESLLNFYRTLVRLRARHPALAVGDHRLLPTGNDGVIAVRRSLAGEIFILVANLSAVPVRDYAIETGGERPTIAPRELLHGAAAGAPAPGGGSYRPFAELPAKQSFLLHWSESGS